VYALELLLVQQLRTVKVTTFLISYFKTQWISHIMRYFCKRNKTSPPCAARQIFVNRDLRIITCITLLTIPPVELTRYYSGQGPALRQDLGRDPAEWVQHPVMSHIVWDIVSYGHIVCTWISIFACLAFLAKWALGLHAFLAFFSDALMTFPRVHQTKTLWFSQHWYFMF
jgi:hypothetical protein